MAKYLLSDLLFLFIYPKSIFKKFYSNHEIYDIKTNLIIL